MNSKQKKNILQVIKKRVLRAVFFLFAFLIGLFLILFILLNIPAVQTYLAQEASEIISKKINYPISISGVEIDWFDTVELDEIIINDKVEDSFIGAEKISINFNLSSLLDTNIITIDHVDLYNPVVSVNWDTETNKMNINEFIVTVRNSFKKKKNKKPKFKPFQILSASIHNGYFSYSDKRKERAAEKRFDQNYFSVDSIYADCNDFFLHRDTVEIDIHHLKGIEQSTHFPLNDVNAFFRYTKRSLEFENVKAQLADSYISNEIIMRYDNPASINYVVDSVNFDLRLDSTVIHTKDLATFAPGVKKLNDTWTFYGNYDGKVTNFNSKNANVYFGKSSHLHGEVSFDGLPNIYETFMKVDLVNSQITAKDLAPYLRKRKYIREAQKFGNIHFSGDFAGFPKDFATHGNFQTDLGNFYSDIRFEIRKDEDYSYYKGIVETNDFKLGKLIDDSRVGKLAMKGKIEGTGFSVEKAKVDLDATIDQIYINKYNYNNIVTNAHFEDEFFKGDISILDTNLSLVTNGTLDLRDGANIIDVKSHLKKAHLKKLNITRDTIIISSVFDFNLKGLDLDEIVGSADMKNTKIYQNGKRLNFDDFIFKSTLEEKQRTFSVNSSILEFDAKGDFKFEEIYNDLGNLAKEYKMLFMNNSKKTREYYEKKKGTTNQYHLSYTALLKDVDPLIHVFSNEFSISEDTRIKGNITQGKTSIVNLYSEIDYFRYQNLGFHNNIVELNSAKSTDSTEALMMCYVTCEKQDLNKVANAKDLLFEGIWYKDTIDFTAKIQQYSKPNYANLHGNITFQKDKIRTTLKNSEVKLVNKIWTIDDNNFISATRDKVTFHDVSLSNKEQRVTVNGAIGKKETTSLSVDNFDLLNLEPLINFKLSGRFSGEAKVIGLWDHKPSIASVTEVKDFKVKNEPIGDIYGKWSWRHSKQKLDLDVAVERDSFKVAQLVGDFTPSNKKSPLDLKAIFTNTDLGFLEELLYGHVTDLKGKGNGEVKITGTIKKPYFLGAPKISGGELTIDYFKTRYRFDAPLYFKGDRIYVKNAVLTDTLWNTRGTLNGGITHDFFKNFKADVSISLNKTYVLNTKENDNSLYYGQAFGTGVVKAFGPFNDLKITSNEIKSEKGTKIYIPLDGTERITQKDYIRFVNRKEREKKKLLEDEDKKKINKKKTVSGITTELNFNVTRDAQFEIIFDKKAGDIVRGNGEGTILMKLDTRGDFDVYGTYEITEGTYNFTLVNLINKAFKIEPNSRITWSGDPYEGQLDIRAAYQQNASILPLLQEVTQNDSTFVTRNPDVRRRVPVIVYLTLDGKLLNPEIGFDIKIKEYPNYVEVEQAIQDLESRIQYNEQLLNNQVFSLMVLKQLSPLDQLQVDIGASSANSVSELLSNQFSYWVGQFDENLEVDIDLSGFDEENNNTFRLRLSYSILDGKIRITRDGNFTNIDDQSQLANVFGEWTIEYLLTDNGKLKMKAYNRTNQNTISTAISNSTSTLYGLSLTYTESFDSLAEIFKRNPNKQEAKKEEDLELEETDNTELNSEEDKDEEDNENR